MQIRFSVLWHVISWANLWKIGFGSSFWPWVKLDENHLYRHFAIHWIFLTPTCVVFLEQRAFCQNTSQSRYRLAATEALTKLGPKAVALRKAPDTLGCSKSKSVWKWMSWGETLPWKSDDPRVFLDEPIGPMGKWNIHELMKHNN